MGQRLVIQIVHNGEPLANAYYHWSAYTGSSLELTNYILDLIDNVDEKYDPKQKAVWLLFQTGARLYPNEMIFINDENIDMAPYQFAYDEKEADRNSGLLSLSQHGMEESLGWAEGEVTIDIGNEEIDFGVYWTDSVDNFLEEYAEDENINDYPVINLDYQLTFGTWQRFYDSIMQILDSGNYHAISPDRETIYQFIC